MATFIRNVKCKVASVTAKEGKTEVKLELDRESMGYTAPLADITGLWCFIDFQPEQTDIYSELEEAR